MEESQELLNRPSELVENIKSVDNCSVTQPYDYSLEKNFYQQNLSEKIDLRFLVLGCSETGKSSLMKRIIYKDLIEKFSDINKYDSVNKTNGCEIHIQTLENPELGAQELKVNLIQIEYLELEGDIDNFPHSEIFLESFFDSYIYGNDSCFINGIIFVFDFKDYFSLEQMKNWINVVNNKLKSLVKSALEKFPENERIILMKEKLKSLPIILIANKCEELLNKETVSIKDVCKSSSKEAYNKFNWIKEEIKNCFDFKDTGNLLFMSKDCSKDDLVPFIQFIEQIYRFHTDPDSISERKYLLSLF